MDECVSNYQLLLSENYIVQPVESIPISVIDYDKMEMAHLIHAGQLTNGVIQIADVNSTLKTKELHPLEVEIQRDLQLKQQQVTAETAAAKGQTSTVIQFPSQIDQEFVNKQKCLETNNSTFDGFMQLQMLDGKDSVLNVNPTKPQESTVCQISSINGPVVLEKHQFIILSNNSVLLNIAPKDQMKEFIDKSDEVIKKPEIIPPSETLNNSIDEKANTNKEPLESDSENEGDDIEPVNDYEPDPDSAGTISADQKEKPNKCYVCFKSFRQKKNMYAHIRKIHSAQPKIEGGILCPLCKMHALRQEHLRNHLELLHEIQIEKEEKLFSTMEEFLSWKDYIQKETLSFYVSKSSCKLLANNQQKTYYKCHRSGNSVSLKKEKKKKLKGSSKIGATCPAAIEVTENVHGINVTFWKTHVGHENDFANLVLSREDKAKIMDYVASGVPWDKVLDTIKKEGSKGSNPPSKLTMISKQDLRNFKKIHEVKGSPDLFSPRKKIQGRKPVKERMLRRASQSLVIEKADMLLNLLETTDVRPEFRPKICLMIDNLISTVKRRAIKSSKKENVIQKRRQWIRQSNSENIDEKDQIGGNSRRNSTREGTQKKVISKFCH